MIDVQRLAIHPQGQQAQLVPRMTCVQNGEAVRAAPLQGTDEGRVAGGTDRGQQVQDAHPGPAGVGAPALHTTDRQPDRVLGQRAQLRQRHFDPPSRTLHGQPIAGIRRGGGHPGHRRGRVDRKALRSDVRHPGRQHRQRRQRPYGLADRGQRDQPGGGPDHPQQSSPAQSVRLDLTARPGPDSGLGLAGGASRPTRPTGERGPDDRELDRDVHEQGADGEPGAPEMRGDERERHRAVPVRDVEDTG